MTITKHSMLNRLKYAVHLAVFCGLATAAVNAQPLAEFADQQISVDEFKSMYLRTNTHLPDTKAEASEFLNRLVNFRLKLIEAKKQGIPEKPELKQEVKQYRDNLAVSFLLENRLTKPGAKKLYDMRQDELQVLHIIKKFKDQGGHIDTVEAYKNATNVLEKVNNSDLPFDSLVVLHSDDDRRATTRGKLGWVIAGQTYPQVDDVLYTMEPGEISERPVRSPYGYHIFKLVDRRPALQRVRGSHILYRLDVQNPMDTAAAYARLSLILDSLKRGVATFEELARRNSDDPVSGKNGGDLGWMMRGTLEPTFETTLLQLDVNEVSHIVRTSFGMHIIKKTGESPTPPFEEQADEMKKLYRNYRFQHDYKDFAKHIREKYPVNISQDVKRLIISRLDKGTTTSTPGWHKKLTNKDMDAYLFRIDGDPYTVRKAVEKIKTDPKLQMRNISDAGLDTIIVLLAEEESLIRESKGLEDEDPEFAALLDEYRSSVYVTALEQDRVIQNTQINEDMIRKYWEDHKDEFRFPERVDFSEIYVYGKEFGQKILDSVRAGFDFGRLADTHTKRTGFYNKQGRWGMTARNSHEVAEHAWTMDVGEISGLVPWKFGFSIIKVHDKEQPRVQTYEEAKAEVRGKLKEDLIEQRTEEWVNTLREKYDVQIHENKLNAVLSAG